MCCVDIQKIEYYPVLRKLQRSSSVSPVDERADPLVMVQILVSDYTRGIRLASRCPAQRHQRIDLADTSKAQNAILEREPNFEPPSP